MNDRLSDRYQTIDAYNLNKPVEALICPRCESPRVVHEDGSDHPGCFECLDCHEVLVA